VEIGAMPIGLIARWSCLLALSGLCVSTTQAQPDFVWKDGYEACEEPVIYFADVDQDGFGDENYRFISCQPPPRQFAAVPGGDCDDLNGAVNPAALDVECDGVDNNCDGLVDEGFESLPCYEGPAGTMGIGQCSAGKDACKSLGVLVCLGQILPQPEVLDGIDNNCNGKVDEGFELICDDGIDNDEDGFTDCEDPDCAFSEFCPL